MSLREAAAMGVAGVTAWRTVTEIAQVSAEDTVLVLGATGGVGSTIVSAARSAGATVIGQTSRPDDAQWVSECGAQPVVAPDASTLTKAVADLHPTVVFDSLGDGFTGAAIEALAPRGRLVLFGASAGPVGELPLLSLYRKGITVFGYAGGLATEEVIHAGIVDAMKALAAGKLTVQIDAVLPLAEVNQAFGRIRKRRVRGKIVLDVREEAPESR